ncbi:sensor histidine kinase [Massilia horti]|uniref:histidine kinase n=1 Tax=Massilia horti TaxID=2562153 RepID=A0A4Y9T023_9BURK|nr:ATP-binding protein [Massilia horti]TFW31185.1 hypothetical protein E4O92_14375 [Massilia horti]
MYQSWTLAKGGAAKALVAGAVRLVAAGAACFVAARIAALRRDTERLQAEAVERKKALTACRAQAFRCARAQRRSERALGEQQAQVAYLNRAVILGELCGAIAHELNQPLAAILANAQAARRCLARDPADQSLLEPILDDIVEADRHAAAVIHHLHLLFLHGEAQLRPLEINAVVGQALQLARCALDAQAVQVHVSLGTGLPPVRGDSVQLQQVLLNLVVNACQAMRATPPETRQLAIQTETGTGNTVRVSVADRGPGIAADALERIFEPFFTTRPQGLGFGLSVSRAIIDAHGGQVEAANDGREGAVFRITLPPAGG